MRAVETKQIRRHALILAIYTALVGTILAQTTIISAVDDNRLKETATPNAPYPKGVWQKGQDGQVTVMFDVTKRGRVQNPCITNSTYPGIFELYALQAVKDFRYENLTRPRELIEGVSTTVDFTLDSNPKDFVSPKYPYAALEFGFQGYVVVKFDVKSNGKVRNFSTPAAVPAKVFEDAALEAARQFRFDSNRFLERQTMHHKFIFSLDSEPNNLVIPEYPNQAKEEGIQGHAIVNFDINSEGSVDRAYVVYSSDSIFDQPAVDAVSQFIFDPNKPAQNVYHKVEFILNRNLHALTKKVPKYPRAAILNRIEGYVIVRFDVDERGSVDNLSVLEAEPPDVFNEAALAATAQFTYLPKYVDGKPVRVQGERNRLRFALGTPNQNARQNTQEIRPQRQGRRTPNRRRQSENPRRQPVIEDRRPESMRNIKLDPIYELQLTGDHDDGSVIVQFDVNGHGYVEGPKILEVIDTSLPEEIKERILDEVSFFWYVPWLKNDQPIRVNGVKHRIELTFDGN
ncbi:MAG: TonB family protein [Gammaproteobacteria bacterium]|nr:TonB family protein [Gammaproteobacteria bacterium]